MSGRGGAGLALRHHEASHGALDSACLQRGESSAPLLLDIRGATKAHLNVTLFDETEIELEEPPDDDHHRTARAACFPQDN